MQIQIVSVDVENKGKYDQATVFYKDVSSGKTGDKKIMSFTNKEVYNTLKNSKKGDSFDIQLLKNEKGYWDWVKISDVGAATPSGGAISKATTTPKSTYETPEERALRQVYIVRQSSIANAIELLKTDKKSPAVGDVLSVAKQFENYVFGNDDTITPLAELPEFNDEDDVPM